MTGTQIGRDERHTQLCTIPTFTRKIHNQPRCIGCDVNTRNLTMLVYITSERPPTFVQHTRTQE